MTSSYRAPPWLIGGHAQTIYPFVLPRPAVRFRRERVDAPDGDFWDFDWLSDETSTSDAPVVVLFHGLEGGSGSHYSRALMAALARKAWRGVVAHFRGCGGTPNVLPRAYHSGDHEEIGRMLQAVHERVPHARVHAVGVSLGGSALLNWLGRVGASAGDLVESAAAVSAPLDLTAAGMSIDRGLNRIYSRHFLQSLVPKGVAMAQRFPEVLDHRRVRGVRTMYDFDDVVTAPLHGFAGTRDYWRRASSKPWLREIAVPTLVINARNDPFVPAASLPGPDEASRCVLLEQPDGGGHAGFLSGPFPGDAGWLPRRLLQFFERAT